MNNFEQFMKGTFKKIEPWVNLAFFIVLAIAGNMGISALKALAGTASALENMFSETSKSSGTGGYTFFQVIYWIVVICAAGFKVMKIVHELNLINPNAFGGNSNNFAQPQQNNFSQPANNFNGMPANTNVAAPAAPVAQAAGGKFCTSCGSAIAEGNQFCVNCGAKVQ